MNLYVAGDSFSDSIDFIEGNKYSWSTTLSQLLSASTYKNVSMGGTSIWWSYNQINNILDSISDDSENILIWSVTDYVRLSTCLTPQHSVYVLHSDVPEEMFVSQEELDAAAIYRKHFFDEDLQKFIAKNCIVDIVNRCLLRNVKLILLMPFLRNLGEVSQYIDDDINVPIIYNLMHRGLDYLTQDYIDKYKCYLLCHMTFEENDEMAKMLSVIICDYSKHHNTKIDIMTKEPFYSTQKYLNEKS